MKFYDISTDKVVDKGPIFIFYYEMKRYNFRCKVRILKRIIRLFGFGVLKEVVGSGAVSAHKIFYRKP